MGVNKLWKDALLTSSRNLRRNVLKGKIWGSPTERDPDDDLFTNASNSPTSSLESLHNVTDGDGPGPHYIRPYRRYRNGRVRGMVESFERSGSLSSDSSFSELAERNAFIAQYDADQDAISQSPVEALSHFPELSAPSPLPLPPAAESPSRSPNKRPLPQIPVHPSLRELPVEEPTVEELIEAEGEELGSSWGARAWEEFDHKPGITVKRLIRDAAHSDDVNPDTTISGLSTIVESLSREGSNSKKLRDERRVVTAIFSPAPSSSQVLGLIQAPELALSRSTREEELEDQVKTTTLILEEYKKRLEEVERKVSHMTEVEVRLTRKIEKADQENKELQEKFREAERTATQPQSDHSSRPHAVDDRRASTVARRKRETNSIDPQSISALSQYVFLVGMGVCAVVFRVVLKKVIGKGLKP